MKFTIGRYMIECYVYGFGLRITKVYTDYRFQIGPIVIDMTDLSVDADKFIQNL